MQNVPLSNVTSMDKLKKSLLYIFPALLIAAFFFAEPAAALTLSDQITGQIQAGADSGGLGTAIPPQQIIASIITVILSVLGIFFMSLIVFGGYLLFTAKGDETKVEKAKNTIRAAIIGLFIILAAYGVTRVVSRIVLQSTSGDPAAQPPGSGIRANCQGLDCELERF